MRIPAAALAASVLLSPILSTPARAAVTQPSGPLCDYYAVSQEGGPSQVVFSAGPLTLADEDGAAVHTGTVTCTLVESWSAADHTGPAWAAVTGPTGVGHAALPPTVVTAPEIRWDTFLSLCTRLDVDGVPLYWHDPEDRNVDGWWTTDPAATCSSPFETADLRAEDPPGRQVNSAIVEASGAADPLLPVVEPPLCAAAEEELGELWRCGASSTATTVSIARAPGTAVLRGAPFLWTCADVHTGLPVTLGSPLTTPDPGVSCVPPAARPVGCAWAQVSGYLAPANLGRVSATSACGAISVTRVLAPAAARVAEQWSGDYGWGTPPWRCVTDEDTLVEPAYVVTCGMLGG